MKIAFIVTNFNNSRHTFEMCQSINNFTDNSHSPIIIVDNNSVEDDVVNLKKIENQFHNVTIIYNSQNVGYFKGLNIGLEYVNKKYDVDVCVVGNNDLTFEKNFLIEIQNKLYLFDKYAVIAPNIITLDNVSQNPHVINNISSFRHFVLDLYYSNYFISLIIHLLIKLTNNIFQRKDYLGSSTPGVIYQGYGACYLIGPLFFKYFNQLFAPTFLMGEEFFLAYQLKMFKLQIFYEPSFKVYHQDHASVGKLNSKFFWSISKESHRIYKKYLKSYDPKF